MVSYLHPRQPTHYVTATAAPCTSLFKPVWLDSGLGEMGPQVQGVFDPGTLFWKHELLHRSTLMDYAQRIRLYQVERDALEARFTSESLKLAGGTVQERLEFTRSCFADASAAEDRWNEQVSCAPVQNRAGWLYRNAWTSFNKQAKFPLL
jgi:secernin